MKQTLIDTAQAATLLSIKPNTLEVWRTHGTGPAYKKIGRLVRYSIDDLHAYLEAQSRTSTTQAETDQQRAERRNQLARLGTLKQFVSGGNS